MFFVWGGGGPGFFGDGWDRILGILPLSLLGDQNSVSIIIDVGARKAESLQIIPVCKKHEFSQMVISTFLSKVVQSKSAFVILNSGICMPADKTIAVMFCNVLIGLPAWKSSIKIFM